MELLNINLRKMQYFLTVIEEGTLSRAAQKLYVTQPLLSKNMKELEAELHVSLFHHKGRKLLPTEAGLALYEDWKRILPAVQSSITKAEKIQQESQKEIRLGCEYVMVLAADSFWVPQVHLFQQEHPDCAVKTIATGLDEEIHKLLQGEIDILVCSSYDLAYLNEEYCWTTIAVSPVYLYTSAENPILQKTDIQWKDLKDEEFMTISPSVIDWPKKLLEEFAHEAGFEPHITAYTNTQMSQLLEIRTSKRLMLSIAFDDLLQDDRIGAIRMPQQTEILAVWKKDAHHHVKLLAQYLKKGFS